MWRRLFPRAAGVLALIAVPWTAPVLAGAPDYLPPETAQPYQQERTARRATGRVQRHYHYHRHDHFHYGYNYGAYYPYAFTYGLHPPSYYRPYYNHHMGLKYYHRRGVYDNYYGYGGRWGRYGNYK